MYISCEWNIMWELGVGDQGIMITFNKYDQSNMLQCSIKSTKPVDVVHIKLGKPAKIQVHSSLIQDSSNTTRDIVTTWQTMLDWLLVHFVSEHQGWIWNWIFAGLFSFVCATGVVSRLTFEIATCHISSIQNPHSQPTWKSWCLKWDRRNEYQWHQFGKTLFFQFLQFVISTVQLAKINICIYWYTVTCTVWQQTFLNKKSKHEMLSKSIGC